MTVADILDRVDELKELSDYLGVIAKREGTYADDANAILDAVKVVDAYIRELMSKEVKE